MRTGHLVERAEITIAIGLLLEGTTRWFGHGEIMSHCTEMMGYKPHDDCVRKVLREMIHDAKAEVSTQHGNFVYRSVTAYWRSRMDKRMLSGRRRSKT